MAIGMMAEPPCAACGDVASRVEVVAPGQLPARFTRWSRKHRQSFERLRDPAQWYLMFQGIVAGNGWVGDVIDADRAQVIISAFQRPYSYDKVHTAGLYDDAGFCPACGVPYCHRHWHVSSTGYGRCPAEHGRSLDPNSSPE